MFASLFRRLAGGHGRPRTARRAANTARFVPAVTALEGRDVPSGAPTVPFHESLTVVRVEPTGAIDYEGQATHLGHVTAVLNPDDTFVKTAANGDTVTGFVTHATATTGTITTTGGTGRFQGATGLSSYVISSDPATGAVTVDVNGTISYAAGRGDARATPFRVTGGGPASQGLPLVPGGTATHQITAGTATHLGSYTGEGTFELGSLNISAAGVVSGTFRGSFVFVAANGDRLVTTYGDGFTGTFSGQLSADGTSVTGVTFDAIFRVDGAASTGRFAGATGSWRMIANAESVSLISSVPGYTAPFNYTWTGEGTIELARGKN
jgi:hypothetical protein